MQFILFPVLGLVVTALALSTIYAATEDLSDIRVLYESLGEGTGTVFKSQLTVKNSGSVEFDSKNQNVTIYVCFIR